MVRVFVDVFWEFDPEAFIFYFPLFGLYLYLLRWFAGGLCAGIVTAVLAGVIMKPGPDSSTGTTSPRQPPT